MPEARGSRRDEASIGSLLQGWRRARHLSQLALATQAEILRYPGVPRSWRTAHPAAPVLPVVPVSFRKDDQELNFFSTVTTLGTPQDITVQELRIECFFPADDPTHRAARRLAAEPAPPAPAS